MRSPLAGPDGRLRSGWRIAAAVLLLVTALVVIDLAWKLLGLPGRQEGGPWFFLLRATLVSASAFAGLAFLLRRFEDEGVLAIGLPLESRAWSPLFLGTTLGSLPVLLVLGSAIAGGYGTVTLRGSHLNDLLPTVLSFFLLAFWEEIALRGYLFRQLSVGINPTAAILITGLLFGALHGANRGANWSGLLLTAVGGVLMGLLFYRTRSLWLLIGYHFGWNTIGSALLGLQLSGAEEQFSVFDSSLQGPAWLTGGSYGFEASLPAVAFEILILSIVLLGLRSRHAAATKAATAR